MKKITLVKEELRSKEHMKSIINIVTTNGNLFMSFYFKQGKWLKAISELLFRSTINFSAPSLWPSILVRHLNA